MMIDAHTHLVSEDGYTERLVEAERAIGVRRFVTFGAGPSGNWASNEEVLAAAERFPDTIIPFACVRLGQVTPEEVERLSRRGFRGLKFTNPTLPYNDPFYWRVYAKTEELRLPVYFHTGIVGRFGDERPFRLDSSRHSVITLDAVARAFPELTIFAAHLGNPEFMQAVMLMRWWPNLYFDLSGSTLKKKPPQFFTQLFWWDETSYYNKDPLRRGPWGKIVFGTDVAPENVADVHADYGRLLRAAGVSQQQRDAVLGLTAARLLGIDESS